ncbi:MAG TPA: 4-alpha-glucanotransferase [Anaerolineales bacterium]|nr:4-alpha-glucanotransferase [Anaerolineales bacterium]
MKFNRSSGVLLHPTSLPGPYGIGDLGPAAYRWVDWLAASGCKLWQVLPLGPTGYGDSPYQCFSAFAGNPYMVSPESLLDLGLLAPSDLADMPAWEPRRADFGLLYQWKPALLAKAYARYLADPELLRTEFEAFLAASSAWLDDFALFMALKEVHGGGPWDQWPEPLRRREPAALEEARKNLAERISLFSFSQFLFFREWQALKEYANGRGLQIIGDIPLFVAYDSSDVWANPDLFYLDQAGKPTVVAGVPPDYFSLTGQLWGNPLYRWEVHKAGGYAWWIERIRASLSLVDIIRIDHFRGFAAYWEIPAGGPTAETGRWVPGPGADFFKVVQSGLGDLPIIAEDLGVITPDVVALRDQFNLPGMKILQFAFSGPDNVFLPHLYRQNCVVYTGTHDNDTSLGWYESAPESEKDFARRYLRVDGRDFPWDLIRAGWGSTAVFALAPMQDLLGLGTEARMNYPSRLGGNWEWRMTEDALGGELQGRIRELNWIFLR